MKSGVPKLDKLFSPFGILLKVKSDKESAFHYSEFDKYTKHLGFIHQSVIPAYSQASGLVENFS